MGPSNFLPLMNVQILNGETYITATTYLSQKFWPAKVYFHLALRLLDMLSASISWISCLFCSARLVHPCRRWLRLYIGATGIMVSFFATEMGYPFRRAIGERSSMRCSGTTIYAGRSMMSCSPGWMLRGRRVARWATRRLSFPAIPRTTGQTLQGLPHQLARCGRRKRRR